MTASLIDAAIVIGATLATTLLLLLISGQLQDTTAGNLIARSAPPALGTTQPTSAQWLPVPPTPSPQPSRSAASPTPSPIPTETASDITDDATVKVAIDKKLQDNPDLSPFSITFAINDGSVTLDGIVPSDELRAKIEKLVRTVRGVKQVDNQIAVISAP